MIDDSLSETGAGSVENRQFRQNHGSEHEAKTSRNRGDSPGKGWTDTQILDWLEERWQRDDDAPIMWLHDGFVGNESGRYGPHLNLRDAVKRTAELREARIAEDGWDEDDDEDDAEAPC